VRKSAPDGTRKQRDAAVVRSIPAEARASDTKTNDQRRLGPCGSAIGARVPIARLRPPRLRPPAVPRASRLLKKSVARLGAA
jgi:hypothetical protein